jgi:polyribonucleotide nucleotidyltransferase
MHVPKEHRGHIVGPAGKTLKSVIDATNVKIKFPKQEDENGAVVLTGNEESVNKAKEMIERIICEKSRFLIAKIVIKKHFHPFLIGQSGEKLRNLIKAISPTVR